MTPVQRLQWLAEINKHPDITPAARAVAIMLAWRADNKGECWPSKSRLASDSGMSKRTIDRGVICLREIGAIHVEVCGVENQLDKCTNLYALIWGCQSCRVSNMRGVNRDSDGVSAVTPKHIKRTDKDIDAECLKNEQEENKCDHMVTPDSKDKKSFQNDLDVQAKEILAQYALIKPVSLDSSRGRAKGHIVKLLKKLSAENLVCSVQNYKQTCETAETPPKYRRSSGNFFGKEADYLEYLPDRFEPTDGLQETDNSHLSETQLQYIQELEDSISKENANE